LLTPSAPQERDYPLVVLAVFLQRPSPFVSVFFERLVRIQYPKHRLKLFISNQVPAGLMWASVVLDHMGSWSLVAPLSVVLLQEPHHQAQVRSFLEDHGDLYQEVRLVGPEEELDHAAARNLGW